MKKLLVLPLLLGISVPAQANFFRSIMNQSVNQEESMIPVEEAPEVYAGEAIVNVEDGEVTVGAVEVTGEVPGEAPGE